MSLDPLFKKNYDKNYYNCAHFVSDAWELVTGRSISHELSCFLAPSKLRHAPNTLKESWVKLDSPTSPCIVLMRKNRVPPHVGMFFEGRVIHITEIGVQYQPLEVVSRGFANIGFYKC